MYLTKLTNLSTKTALCPVDDINTKKPQYLYDWYCGFCNPLYCLFNDVLEKFYIADKDEKLS